MKGGLLRLPKDDRDIHLGAIVKLPELHELPPNFSLGDTPIRNQEADGNYDFCTAYGTVGMSYLMDGVEGSPEWVFAASKEISGNNEAFGQDMRTIFKTWVQYGSPKREEVVPPMEARDRRYLKNYDSRLDGSELKKKTYVSTKGQYDAFDNIRASLYQLRNQRRAVGIGVDFTWSLSSKYLTSPRNGGFGHFMFVTGWESIGEIPYLVVVNSYGKEAGVGGRHYMPRETINYFVKKYGAMTLIDLPVEDARTLQEYRQGTSWLVSLFRRLWTILLNYRAIL